LKDATEKYTAGYISDPISKLPQYGDTAAKG
jgi:hypothetical protein